jgi:hypothetical protein
MTGILDRTEREHGRDITAALQCSENSYTFAKIPHFWVNLNVAKRTIFLNIMVAFLQINIFANISDFLKSLTAAFHNPVFFLGDIL